MRGAGSGRRGRGRGRARRAGGRAARPPSARLAKVYTDAAARPSARVPRPACRRLTSGFSPGEGRGRRRGGLAREAGVLQFPSPGAGGRPLPAALLGGPSGPARRVGPRSAPPAPPAPRLCGGARGGRRSAGGAAGRRGAGAREEATPPRRDDPAGAALPETLALRFLLLMLNGLMVSEQSLAR